MGARDHIYTGKSTFMVELMVRDLPLKLGLTTACSTDLFGHGIVDTVQCTWNVHMQYFIASLVPRPPPPVFVIIMRYTACIT